MVFLGVENSLTGRCWIGPSVEVQRAAEALVQATGLPASLCQVLARRGVEAPEVPGFLSPRLKDLLPDPRSIRDMQRAGERVLQAVRDG